MMADFRLRLLLTSSVALPLSTLAAAAPAYAQESQAGTQASAQAGGEIVVSARRRGDEALSRVGGSIQVLGGEELAQKGVVSFDDYSRQIAGISANNQGPGQTQISFRGMNSSRLNHANPNVPATVAIYFGATALTSAGFNPDAGLVDVSRVEVLRGPQGTLFGASAMSGMIRIIPNDPKFDRFEASGTITGFATKSGGSSFAVNAAANIPVTDNFALRVVGYNNSNGGYIDNIYDGQKDYNDDRTYGGRIVALYQPTPEFSAKVTAAYQNAHSDGRPQEYVPGDPAAGRGLVSGVSILQAGETLAQFRATSGLQTSKQVPDTFDDRMWFVTGELSAQLSDAVTITSATSYLDRKFLNRLDDTYRERDFAAQLAGFGATTACATGPGFCYGANNEIPIYRGDFRNDNTQQRFSEDLTANIKFSDNFSAVMGAYYEREKRSLSQAMYVLGFDAWHASPTTGATLGGFLPLTLSTQNAGVDNLFDGIFALNTRQIAAYGELSAKFGKFELNIGARYFDYKQKARIRWNGYLEFADDRLDDGRVGDSGINPKFEAIFRPTDNITTYVSAAKGFRLGSVAQFINQGFCATELQQLGVSSIPDKVKSDSLWNYEAGVKTRFHGGSLNVSAYRMDWKNARTQVFLSCGWIAEFNDAQIRSEGIEAEFNFSPVRGLVLNGSVSYNNSRLSAAAPSIKAAKGDPTPFAPKWTANAGFEYTAEKALFGWDWFVGGDVSFIDQQYTELGAGTSLTRYVLPSSTVFNARTGFAADNWRLSFFVRNLTNERIVTGADIDRRQPLHYAIGRPLNAGMTLQFNM